MKLGKTANAILNLMLEVPEIKIPRIAERRDRSERAIELRINKLKESQVVERISPPKNGQWDVKE